ncbi:protein 4.1 homolog [Plakobranchus ocellatus]|uniref:Protein 4.1 homolog n=1 Tax=Plakobranchus ocellatus TaxID=259542 RepID=A0AAV3ZNR2_9GAST|nr:protein 4.1 homolog [Plakobranchus ocellatus]
MSNASPQKPQKPSGKQVTCNVFLLSGESIEITLDKNDIGRALFDKVCEHQDLIEKDYFGFTYTDDRGPSHLKYWLNLDKKISKQKKKGAWVFEFALKFYPPDPTHLRESFTRWLVVLQVRRDLLSGRIPCTFTTYALLGSYNVQAIIGEYDPSEHGHSFDHIKDMAFAPNQTPELLEKIAELHKHHKGLTPDEAEKCFLDNAKKLAMYGVDMHKAKDADNNAVMLGVCCSGLLIYRDKLRINRFVWPKILKLSYKRNHFYIKIRPGELERNEASIMFKLDNHRLAKRLWKTCVEHHAFFRLREAEKPANNVSFPRFGSKFRYSGRTLYQTRQTAALLDRPPPFFERSMPGRNSMADEANRSRSMDELGSRYNRDPYNDSAYDPNRSMEYDPNRSRDENDRRDMKGVPPAYATTGRDGKDSRFAGDEDTLQRRPYDSDTADRHDKLPGQGDATLERERGRGQGLDDSMGLTPGQDADPYAGETDKERRKREKEDEKRRKKEAEEEKKRKKGKKGKDDLNTSEDRLDNMGVDDATARALGRDPGSMGLDGDTLHLGGTHPGGESTDHEEGKGLGRGHDHPDALRDQQDAFEFNLTNPSDSAQFSTSTLKLQVKVEPRECDDEADASHLSTATPNFTTQHYVGNLIGANAGYPYGIGLGVGKGDMTGVVGDESSVDNKQQFLPLTQPIRETKDSLKSGYSDNMMPFFHPAATSTVGRGKVPPPVPPKGSHGLDDSFNPPTVATEKVKYNPNFSDVPMSSRNIPLVKTETRTVTYERGDRSEDDWDPGLLVSAQSHTSKLQTIETTTYKTERDGVEETRVVQKVVMSGEDEDDFDFDSALAEAIRSATELNPDMSVERIECVQQIEDVKNGN